MAAFGFGRTSLARTPELPGGAPAVLDLLHRPPATDDADGSLLPGLDATPPAELKRRLADAGWVALGEAAAVETALWTSHEVSVARIGPGPGTVDGTVVLYRFRHAAFVDRVLPFVESEEGVVWVRGERSLLFAHVKKNPAASDALLRSAGGLPYTGAPHPAAPPID